MAGEAGGVAKAIAIEKRGGLWLGGNGPEGDVYHVKLRISSHEISAATGTEAPRLQADVFYRPALSGRIPSCNPLGQQQMLARNWHDDAISSELGSFCQKSHLIAGLTPEGGSPSLTRGYGGRRLAAGQKVIGIDIAWLRIRISCGGHLRKRRPLKIQRKNSGSGSPLD